MTPTTTMPARPEPDIFAVERRRLEPLGYRSCVELLTGANIGRVIYSKAAMPAAEPVTFRIDGDDIVFCTDRDSALELALAGGAVVAFEADNIDVDDTQDGWSVLAVGRAHRVTDPQRVAHLNQLIPRSAGNRPATTTVAIPITQVTGSRLPAAARCG